MIMIVEEVKMHIKNNNLIFSNLIILFFLIISLFGCAGSNPLRPGAWVAEENRVSLLDSGQRKGSWQTRDLSIVYEILPEEKSIQISGVVEFANYITTGFNALEYLTIYIHVLEADGFVEHVKEIKTFGYRRSFDLLGQLAFDTRMDLSEDAVAIAFSYNGKVIEGGDRGVETAWDLWKVPRRKKG